jgi:hypothetical protein
MARYARMCGWTLARAHARTGDRIAIAAYLGNSDKFDQALADFAESYADRTEMDYAALPMRSNPAAPALSPESEPLRRRWSTR